MEKYIAYEKLSKKEKREIASYRRKTWGALSPVTRKPTNSKAYNRKKNQYWKLLSAFERDSRGQIERWFDRRT